MTTSDNRKKPQTQEAGTSARDTRPIIDLVSSDSDEPHEMSNEEPERKPSLFSHRAPYRFAQSADARERTESRHLALARSGATGFGRRMPSSFATSQDSQNLNTHQIKQRRLASQASSRSDAKHEEIVLLWRIRRMGIGKRGGDVRARENGLSRCCRRDELVQGTALTMLCRLPSTHHL